MLGRATPERLSMFVEAPPVVIHGLAPIVTRCLNDSEDRADSGGKRGSAAGFATRLPPRAPCQAKVRPRQSEIDSTQFGNFGRDQREAFDEYCGPRRSCSEFPAGGQRAIIECGARLAENSCCERCAKISLNFHIIRDRSLGSKRATAALMQHFAEKKAPDVISSNFTL